MKSEWSDINIGDSTEFEVNITPDMLNKFIGITGDDNRLHTDQTYAKSLGFSNNIAHGMLVASHFSRLVGRFFLGDKNLYLSQKIDFRRPVYLNQVVIVYGNVLSKSESFKTLNIETIVYDKDRNKLISGQALVKSL